MLVVEVDLAMPELHVYCLHPPLPFKIIGHASYGLEADVTYKCCIQGNDFGQLGKFWLGTSGHVLEDQQN